MYDSYNIPVIFKKNYTFSNISDLVQIFKFNSTIKI